MEDAKAAALFREVSEKTRARRIKWEPTASEDTFVASIGGKFTLLIRSYEYVDADEDRIGYPALILKDAEDRELLRVTAGMLERGPQELQNLYDLVLRQALRVEEKVDDLL